MQLSLLNGVFLVAIAFILAQRMLTTVHKKALFYRALFSLTELKLGCFLPYDQGNGLLDTGCRLPCS